MRQSGFPEFRISRYPDFRISGFPGIWISGYSGYQYILDIRIFRSTRISGKSGYPDFRQSENPEIRKVLYPKTRISGYPEIRKLACGLHISLRITYETGLSWPYGLRITYCLYRIPYLQECRLLSQGQCATDAGHNILEAVPRRWLHGSLAT